MPKRDDSADQSVLILTICKRKSNMGGKDRSSSADGLDNSDFYVSVHPAIKTFIIFFLFYIMPCIIWAPEYLPSPEYTGE